MNALIPTWKKLLQLGLDEDSFAFDWTARATEKARGSKGGKGNAPAKAFLIAKANGIWAGEVGLKALELLSAEMGMPLKIKSFVKDGDSISPKQKICEWTGEATSLVVFERTFINLAAYASGIATQTHALVTAVKKAKLKNAPRITGTRKTLPGFKDLAIQSTLIGGALPHRYNLSGGLLLKENHIAAAGGIEKAVKNARDVVPHPLKIEIEVRDLKELKQAIQAGAEVIMLDNFEPALVKEAIKLKPFHTIFEISGGINLSNITNYCIEGLDVISVGSITHSVQALDLSLLIS